MTVYDGQYSQYASINGARLYYLDRGQGPPLLLIHGLGATHADWNGQIEFFSRSFRVIAPDLRGHGDSDDAAPYSLERFATDLLRLVEQLNFGSYAIVGHSMGGAVAMQMAILRPDRIAKLVLTNTLPSFVPTTWPQKRMHWYRLLMIRIFGLQKLSEAVAKNMFPGADQKALREQNAANNGKISKQVYLASLKSLTGWSVQDKLLWLRMPTLILAAQNDYFDPTQAQVFADSLPDGRCLVFEGAHHGLPMERPDEFNRAVLEFLLPGGNRNAGPSDATLNWLRVDTKQMPKVDVQSLLVKPGK